MIHEREQWGRSEKRIYPFFQSVCFVLVQFLYVLNSVDLESVFCLLENVMEVL